MKFNLTNTGALQLFYLFRQGSVVIIAILLAKSRLSLADIGGYEMLMYVGYALSFWWLTGLVQGLLSQYPRLDAKAQRKLLFNAYGLFVVISGVILCLGLAFRAPLLSWLVGQSDLRYFPIFLWYAFLNFPTYLLEHLLLLQQRPRTIVAFGIFAWLGQMVVVLLPVYAGFDFYWSFVGLALVAAGKHLWLLTNVWRHAVWQFQLDLVRQWLKLSWPLLLYALLGGLHIAFDNWLVNYYYRGDEAVFAIFRYGAQELPFTMALVSALGMSVLPELAQNPAAALATLRAKSRRLFHWLFPVSIGLMLVSRLLFPVVFSPALADGVEIFNIYLLLMISRLLFPRTVLMAFQANQAVLAISIVELAVNVIASWWLIHWLGLPGVAWGTLIAYTLEKVLLGGYLRARFGVGVGAYTDLRWLAIYSLALIGAYLLSNLILD